MNILKRYLISGLILWIPIIVTMLVLEAMIHWMDKTLLLLPAAWRPAQLWNLSLPGLGLILALVVLLLTGMLVTNFLGKKLVACGEFIVTKIPVVRAIYLSAKQITHTVLASEQKSFRQAVLVEYPRAGLWSLAFVTNTQHSYLQNKLAARGVAAEELLSIFIPTTPNPTSGFLMLVPKQDVVELDLGVDEVFKMIISLGVVNFNQNIAARKGKQIPGK